MQFPNSIKNLACEISRLRRVASATQFSPPHCKKGGALPLGSHRLFLTSVIFIKPKISQLPLLPHSIFPCQENKDLKKSAIASNARTKKSPIADKIPSPPPSRKELYKDSA